MESTNRKDRRQSPQSLMSESNVQTNSGNEPEQKSEEYKNFESFAKRLGSITRSELDAILENEQKLKERGGRKTKHK